jgi:hypothetical protein
MDSFFSRPMLNILAFVGFVRAVVPELFDGARLCMQQFNDFVA